MFKGSNQGMHLRTTLSQRSVISHCKRRLQGIPLMRAYVWCSALDFKDIFILAVRETWRTDTFRVRSTVMFQTLVSRIEQSVPAPSPASIPVLRVFQGFIKQQTLPNLSEKSTSSISKREMTAQFIMCCGKQLVAPTGSPCHVGTSHLWPTAPADDTPTAAWPDGGSAVFRSSGPVSGGESSIQILGTSWQRNRFSEIHLWQKRDTITQQKKNWGFLPGAGYLMDFMDPCDIRCMKPLAAARISCETPTGGVPPQV